MPRKNKPAAGPVLPEKVQAALKQNGIPPAALLKWRLCGLTLWVVTTQGKKLQLAVEDDPA